MWYLDSAVDSSGEGEGKGGGQVVSERVVVPAWQSWWDITCPDGSLLTWIVWSRHLGVSIRPLLNMNLVERNNSGVAHTTQILQLSS